MIALPDFLLAHPDLVSLSDRPVVPLYPPRPARGHRNLVSEVIQMSTDALSDVLSAVRLSGSVFFDVTAKSPWVAEAPPGAQIANDVMPGAQHAIEYHVITRGSCWISLVGDVGFEPVKLEQGARLERGQKLTLAALINRVGCSQSIAI